MSALADTRGKLLARSLEVNLTAHCNLTCYGCDHVSPLHAEGFLSIDELAKDLRALSQVYHVFEFNLTGGEPLLHPEIVKVVDTIRASGITEKISLITNGVLLHKAPPEVFGKIDKLGVSIYPGVTRKVSEQAIRQLAARNGLLLWYKPTNDFTARLLHAENPDKELVQRVFSTCTLRHSCHTLHEGRYYKCSPSPFIPDWLQRVKADPKGLSGDSVPVRDNPNLREELEAYLHDQQPLGACHYCLGNVGRTVASRQMNKVAMQQWLAEKAPDIQEAVDWPALQRAEAELKGLVLTGHLRTHFVEKLRWTAGRWAVQLLGISLIGVRVRRFFRRMRGATPTAAEVSERV